MRACWIVTVAGFVLLSFLAAASVASAQTNVLFIVDASGSMKKIVGGNETRMDAAKRVLADALKQMPQDARLGLLTYGHRRANDCKDIELLSPIGADDAAKIAAEIKALQPKGETPIAAALEQAVRSFAALKGQANSIVLVTDGVEECRGDPCAAARAVKAAGLDLKVNIVGFTLGAKERQAIECVATETGGTYYDASNAAALTTALATVTEQVTAPKPDEGNLLAKANGGRLVAAPRGVWERAIDGKEELAAFGIAGDQVVFGFKDGRSAAVSKFAFLVPQTADTPDTIEIMIGDDGPLGDFRTVATMSPIKLRMTKSPFQEIEFAEVTARYVKLKFSASTRPNGDRTKGLQFWEMRLFGKLADDAPSPAPVSAGIDLISPAQGGQLLASSTPKWQSLTDGQENFNEWYLTNEEAVYAFRDEKPATLQRFEFLVSERRQIPISMELFISDQGPAGPFRSVGVFQPANTRLYETPYQRFDLGGVKARYFKIKMGEGWAGLNVDIETMIKEWTGVPRTQTGSGMWQYRLIGQLE